MVVLSPISNPLLVPAQYPPDPNPPGPIRGPFRVCGQLRQLDPSGCAAQILRRQQFQTLKIKAISSNRYKSLFFREDYQPWVFFGPQSDREHRCFDLRKVMLFGTSYCILLAEQLRLFKWLLLFLILVICRNNPISIRNFVEFRQVCGVTLKFSCLRRASWPFSFLEEGGKPSSWVVNIIPKWSLFMPGVPH